MAKYRIQKELLHKKRLGKNTFSNRLVYREQVTLGYATEVFHYTSPEGLMGILKSREIFFTDSQFLNDYNERFDINSELKFFWDSKYREYDKDFYSLIRNIYVDSYEDNNYAYIDKETPEEVCRYFILSASMNSDSLSLWKYYSKNGTYNGYSMGLYIPALTDEWIDRETGVAVETGLVIYSSNKKQEKISNMIETLYEVWCTYKRSDEMDCKVCKEYKAWISYASLFFKKQCFSAEEEMRFVATIRKNELNNLFYELDNGNKIKMYAFRNVGGVITPYIKMPLFGWSDETSWVTSNVVVGPCMDYSQKKDGILRFVDSLDYKFHDLHVKESEIPVRY